MEKLHNIILRSKSSSDKCITSVQSAPYGGAVMGSLGSVTLYLKTTVNSNKIRLIN